MSSVPSPDDGIPTVSGSSSPPNAAVDAGEGLRQPSTGVRKPSSTEPERQGVRPDPSQHHMGGCGSLSRRGLELLNDILKRSPPKEAHLPHRSASAPTASRSACRKRRRCRSQRIDVPVSLEDLCQGTTRTVDLTTFNCLENGSIHNRKKQLQICILPGWQDGTEVCFPGEGDRMHGVASGDVIAVLRQRPHPRYRRHGDDLETTAVVSLPEAIHGCTIELPHPSGTPVFVRLQPIRHPEDRLRVRGFGMPQGAEIREDRADSVSSASAPGCGEEAEGEGAEAGGRDRVSSLSRQSESSEACTAAHACGDLILKVVVDFGRGSERMQWAERAAVLDSGVQAARRAEAAAAAREGSGADGGGRREGTSGAGAGGRR